MIADFVIVSLGWYISNVSYHIQCMVLYGMKCMESVYAWECAKMHGKQR